MDWKEHKGMIYVFIAFMLIMSFFASLSLAQITRVAAYQAAPEDSFLAISLDKQMYYVGEAIRVDVYSTGLQACSTVTLRLRVWNMDNNLYYDSIQDYLGNYPGGYPIVYASHINTEVGYIAGNYQVQGDWYCGTQLVLSEYDYYFQLVTPEEVPDMPYDPIDPIPICNIGEKLDSTGTVCIPAWTANNGVCEYMEPTWSADCTQYEDDSGAKVPVWGDGSCDVGESCESPDCADKCEASLVPGADCPYGFYEDSHGVCRLGNSPVTTQNLWLVLAGVGVLLVVAAVVKKK